MKNMPMQTVFIDVGEELNRIVAIANLVPTTNLDVIEQIMLQLRQDPSNAAGAKVSLDMIQATRELRSAGQAYTKFVIELAEAAKRAKPAGDTST